MEVHCIEFLVADHKIESSLTLLSYFLFCSLLVNATFFTFKNTLKIQVGKQKTHIQEACASR
jgi:hypothetical protein